MNLTQSIYDFQQCIEQRDQAEAERLLDPGFALMLAYPDHAIMPRAKWLALLPEYVVHSYDLQDRRVDTDADCGAVLQRAYMSATVAGVDRTGMFVISDVWRIRDGEWRLWRRHSTPLLAQPMPGI